MRVLIDKCVLVCGVCEEEGGDSAWCLAGTGEGGGVSGDGWWHGQCNEVLHGCALYKNRNETLGVPLI